MIQASFNVGRRHCITLQNVEIRRWILYRFQRQINVVSMIVHNIETTLIRRWNIG